MRAFCNWSDWGIPPGTAAEWDAWQRAQRPERPPPRKRLPRKKFCLFCLAPLANASVTCDETCDDWWWEVVPTVGGETYEPRHRYGWYARRSQSSEQK
jgi:hypothetical protein